MDAILSSIESPADVKKLDQQQLARLAEEIRAELIQVLSKNGGHLGPNFFLENYAHAFLQETFPVAR